MKVAEGRQRQERVPEALAAFVIFVAVVVATLLLNLTDATNFRLIFRSGEGS